MNNPDITITVLSNPEVSVTVGETLEVAVSMDEMVVPVTVNVGANGLPGVNGVDAESETYTAAVTMGGHRAVGLNSDGELVYASATLAIEAIGIIRDAVTIGGTVTVYRAGRVGGFTGLTVPGTYFLGDTGLLTLTPLTEGGLLQILGIASSATELLVDPGEPFII